MDKLKEIQIRAAMRLLEELDAIIRTASRFPSSEMMEYAKRRILSNLDDFPKDVVQEARRRHYD